MIPTYASVLAVCAASLAVGGAIVRACGARELAWISPAAGFAALVAFAWWTVRLPGGGTTAAVLIGLLSLGSLAYLLRGGADLAGAAITAAPVALLALLATALPFVAEGRFGILGTGFNPDMSQHLLAASRLADGADSQLAVQGYPLGPHSIVVALHDGLGVGLVQGFSGLTISVLVLACVTALAAFADLPPLRRTVACLLVGAPYMVASYFAQGAFKEVIEALFLLAMVLGLRAMRGRATPFVAAPLAVLAAGAAYAYSFPGLIWLGGVAAAWAALELLWARDRRAAQRAALAPALVAGAVSLALIAPEISRMIDFRSFETFDPNGAGLGNLFGQISPFEALGIWPSGDFRLTPGDGAVPAFGYYLGVAFALVLFGHGLAYAWKRREASIFGGALVVIGIYALARATGTPYQAAKAIELIAPVAALTIVLPLAQVPILGAKGGGQALVRGLVAAAFAVAAGVCTALALANAPVGPTDYSPKLTELRPTVAAKPTLVVPSKTLLAEHGVPYISWELRGGRVCIAAAGERDDVPAGVVYVVSEGVGEAPPFPGLTRVRAADPFTLWSVDDPVPGKSPCPLIAVRSARQGR